MPIKIGTVEVGSILRGSTVINKIYRGTTVIYELADGTYLELIEDITVGSAVTSVQFSGFTATKEDTLLLVSDINNTVANMSYSATVNNNSTRTNYWRQHLLASGSVAPSGARANVPDYTYSDVGQKTISISDIKLTNDGYFTMQINNTLEYSSTLPRIFDINISSTFTMTSITQLDITALTANGIGVGSRFTLYRLVGA